MEYANLIERVNANFGDKARLFGEVASHLMPTWEYDTWPFAAVKALEAKELFLKSINPETCSKEMVQFILNLLYPQRDVLRSWGQLQAALASQS